MSLSNNNLSRRDLLRGGAGLLGTTLLSGVASRLALANNHPHQHSLDYLDPTTYISRPTQTINS